MFISRVSFGAEKKTAYSGRDQRPAKRRSAMVAPIRARFGLPKRFTQPSPSELTPLEVQGSTKKCLQPGQTAIVGDTRITLNTKQAQDTLNAKVTFEGPEVVTRPDTFLRLDAENRRFSAYEQAKLAQLNGDRSGRITVQLDVNEGPTLVGNGTLVWLVNKNGSLQLKVRSLWGEPIQKVPPSRKT